MGTYYGVVNVAHQALHHQARIVAAAEADADIDALPRQILQLSAGLQHHLDIWMAVDELAQPRRQPARRERWNRRNRQAAVGAGRPQIVGRDGDVGKSLA